MQQVTYAHRHDATISWHDVLTEMAYPATTPDSTSTYATVDGEPLDIDTYLPTKPNGRPTTAIVLAHSGGFHAVDFTKSDLRGTARWLADHGTATFAIDYRLAAPTSPTWNKAPQDLVCALAWVHEHATEYNVDPSAISLGGMSAGGALALTAAYRLHNNTITSSCGPTPAPPASVVAFYPAVDVNEMWQNDRLGSRNAATLFTGGSPETVPDRYREASPSNHIRPGLMPTLLVVGDRDHSATPNTITAFGEQLRHNGNTVTVNVLPYADHTFDDAYGSITSQTSRHILNSFLHRTT
jgi:acetyl esterase/lipase